MTTVRSSGFSGTWLLLFAVLLAACQQQAPPAPSATAAAPGCELAVGWDPWEPYQYEDADGSVRGLDIEIVSLLARDAGCTVKFTRGNWLDLLRQLRDGEVHVLLAATVIPERQQYALFSEPYRQESFALYVRSDDLGALAPLDLEALAKAGRRVGYTQGYYYGAEVDALASDDKLGAHFMPAPVVESNYARLMDGGIDALLDDPFVASSVIRRKGWAGRIARHPHVIASGHVALMFSRKAVTPAVVERFNAALAKRRQDNTLAGVLGRYQG